MTNQKTNLIKRLEHEQYAAQYIADFRKTKKAQYEAQIHIKALNLAISFTKQEIND